MTQLYDPKIAASALQTARQILIPMIRQVYPTMLANQIAGLQPMTDDYVGTIFTMRFNYATQPKYKFSRAKWYEAKLYKNVDDALDWCEQQFGKAPNYPDAWSRWYFNVNRTFRFCDVKDYEWFMLRWS